MIMCACKVSHVSEELTGFDLVLQVLYTLIEFSSRCRVLFVE